MFSVGDKVIYKLHYEYGIGTIYDNTTFLYTNCFGVNFSNVYGEISVKYYDLVRLEDFCKNVLMNVGATQPALNNTSHKGLGLKPKIMWIDEINIYKFNKFDTTTNKGDKNMNGVNFSNNFSEKSVEIHINPNAEICFKSNLTDTASERIAKLLKETFNKQPTVLSLGVDNNGGFTMPNIKNYKYAEDTAVTTIEWSDGTKTTVRAEYPETADPYTGFMTACAKKAFGNNNTANNLFDEWTVKKPARETKAKIKANAAELEAKRIAEKRKSKREKWLIRKRAAEINREYEARKLAHEKYGVPMDEKKGE